MILSCIIILLLHKMREQTLQETQKKSISLCSQANWKPQVINIQLYLDILHTEFFLWKSSKHSLKKFTNLFYINQSFFFEKIDAFKDFSLYTLFYTEDIYKQDTFTFLLLSLKGVHSCTG